MGNPVNIKDQTIVPVVENLIAHNVKKNNFENEVHKTWIHAIRATIHFVDIVSFIAVRAKKQNAVSPMNYVNRKNYEYALNVNHAPQCIV